jgi:hypothetical protein
VSRGYREHPDAVTERRLSTASTPRKPLTDDFWGKMTALQVSHEPDAEAERHAGRLVARVAMLGAHGCSGTRCPHARHRADASVRDELLSVLGLGDSG